MSDDRTPLRDERADELAAAFLDGYATPAEQAEVETSPELQALVGTFRSQAARLRDLPPASAAARESAIAAALAAAGTAAAPIAPPPPGNVVSLRRSRRILAVAAGVAAAGVLGVVGLASFGGTDRSGSVGLEADSQAGESANIAVAGSGDPKAVSDSRVSDPAVAGTGGLGPIVGPSSALVEVQDEAQLRAFVESGAEATFVAPSFEVECPIPTDQTVIAQVSWRGTPALVLRDTVSGQITAIDAQCSTLATVTP